MKRTERLDKILSHMGFGTRSGIRKLVKDGAVTVNGARSEGVLFGVGMVGGKAPK